MSLVLTKTQLANLKDGTTTVDEVAMQLLQQYDVLTIAKSLVEVLSTYQEEEIPITVSQDEYKRIMDRMGGLLKVRGIRQDGTAEYRGRKRKENKE